jgi:hypothetical protein
MILAVTLLFAAISFSQTYQGPQQGSVNSGAIVNTNSFPEFPISGDTDPIIRGEFNIEGNFEPMFIESDGKVILPTTYSEDKNVSEILDSVGANSMLIEKFNVTLDNNVIPPDPTIAVGPNHIMLLTNNGVGIRIYDKHGTLLKSISSNAWWSSVWPSQSGDPQILYDHYANRWFMLFMQVDDVALTGGNLIAYSDDDDPLGTWYMYRLDTKLHGNTPSNTWGDYPQIGFDEQAIYIMTRCFTFGGVLNYTKIRIISKAELYASNAGPFSYKDIWDITDPAIDPTFKPDVIHPSFQYSATGEHYLLFANRFGANFYSLYKITNPITAPVLTRVNIIVPEYGNTPDANQLGGGTPKIASNGSHIKTAPVFRDGYLYAVHSIQNSSHPDTPYYASIKYVKIDVATNTIVESAELGADGYYYIYPAIAVDKDGNVAITCSRSGDREYIGSYYTTRRATDAPGLSSSRTLQPGLGNYVITYGGTRNRWGDYLGVFLDPSDEYSFWMVSEYASGINSPAYACVVGQVRLQPLPGIYAFLAEDNFDFGTTEIGTDSDTIDVIISNYGVDPLIINSIPDSQGDFFRASIHSFPVTINTFDTLIVKMVFNPTSFGAQTTVYPIDNNSGTFTDISLNGFGYEMYPASSKILYGISGLQNSGNTLYINTNTGVGTNLGESNYTNFLGMAIHPVTNQIYGVISNPIGSDIYRINAQLGDAYYLTSLATPNLYSLAFDNNEQLYGTFTNGEIRKINLETGKDSLVSSTPIFPLAITFNPANNELWGSFRKGFGLPKDLLVKIDLITGDTTNIGQTGFAVNTTDLEFDEMGILYGVKGSGSTVSDLFSIDKLTGVGTLIGSTGIKDIKALGFSLGNITSVHENSEVKIPAEYVLEQNYPNPFNPSTQIKFGLPFNSSVRITIYNLLGEVVRELVNTDMNSGVHTVQWNAEDISGRKVSSGIYFYELNAHGVNGNQFDQVRKMILMK